MQKKDIFYISSFAVISFLIFLPQYISNKIIAWLDMIYYFVPFKEIIVENLKNKILPLWNPYIYCGQPLLANFQSAVLYPMNIFYYAFPIDIAFKINTFLIYFIMATFLYLFFKEMYLSEEASFISSFLFSFTAYMTIRSAEWADLHTIAWMPAALYFSKIALKRNRLIDHFLTIISITMSFLSGHPQVFIYMFLLFTAFYFYWTGFKEYKKFFLYIIFLFLLTVVQILPTIEFINFSSRISEYKLFYDIHSYIYMKFDHLIQMFFPFVKIFFSEESHFINWMALIDIGIISLLLSAFAIATMSDIKLKDFLLILFFIAFVFSFLGSMPLFKQIYDKLFFLHFFRYPAKINVFLLFVLCFFAGAGFDLLFNENYKNKKNFLNVLVLINVIFIFTYIILYYFKIQIFKILLKYAIIDNDFEKILINVNIYDTFLNDAAMFLVILFLFMSITYFIIQKEINNYKIKIILIFLIIINVFLFNKSNYGCYTEYYNLNSATKISNFLNKQTNIKNHRILAPFMKRPDSKILKKQDITIDEKYDLIRSTLLPNIPLFYRFYNLDGFDSLIIASTYDFNIRINKYKSPWDNDMFSLLATKYIVSFTPLKGKTIRKVFFDDLRNVYLYEKINSSEMIYFVPLKYAVYVNNKDEEIKELYETKYEYNKKIVINKQYKNKFDKFLDKNFNKTNNKISYKFNNINNISINTDTEINGFVVISENFYPGWELKIDGIKNEIIKVNGFLKGVFIEKGRHLIELEYKPMIFYIGYIISFIVLLFMLIFCVWRIYESKI